MFADLKCVYQVYQVCVCVCVKCNPTLTVCVFQVWSWSVWMKSWGRRCINATLQVITAALKPQQPEWNRLKPSASWRRESRRNKTGPSSRPSRCSNHETQLPPGRRQASVRQQHNNNNNHNPGIRRKGKTEMNKEGNEKERTCAKENRNEETKKGEKG